MQITNNGRSVERPSKPRVCANGTGKEGEEALGARVDDVDLVQADRVDNFLPLLQLSLGRVDQLDLRLRSATIVSSVTTNHLTVTSLVYWVRDVRWGLSRSSRKRG